MLEATRTHERTNEKIRIKTRSWYLNLTWIVTFDWIYKCSLLSKNLTCSRFFNTRGIFTWLDEASVVDNRNWRNAWNEPLSSKQIFGGRRLSLTRKDLRNLSFQLTTSGIKWSLTCTHTTSLEDGGRASRIKSFGCTKYTLIVPARVHLYLCLQVQWRWSIHGTTEFQKYHVPRCTGHGFCNKTARYVPLVTARHDHNISLAVNTVKSRRMLRNDRRYPSTPLLT